MLLKTLKSCFIGYKTMCGKEENAGYQHFLLLPQCFQKVFSLQCVKSRHCVVMGYHLISYHGNRVFWLFHISTNNIFFPQPLTTLLKSIRGKGRNIESLSPIEYQACNFKVTSCYTARPGMYLYRNLRVLNVVRYIWATMGEFDL